MPFNVFEWNQSVWNQSPSGPGTNTCWTLGSMRAACRDIIVDPANKWWTDSELNSYINDWQNTLQSKFEFVWGTATISTALATISLSVVSTQMLRPDAIYFTPGGTNTLVRRLSPRNVLDLDELQMDWRSVTTNTGMQPEISYQNDGYTVSFWPPPPGTGTYIFEFPLLLNLVNDSDVQQIPCWTRYSMLQYVAMRAFQRFGPNQDIPKAQRRKRLFEMQLRKIRKFYDGYLPEHTEMLRPGRKWAGEILLPRANNLQIP